VKKARTREPARIGTCLFRVWARVAACLDVPRFFFVSPYITSVFLTSHVEARVRTRVRRVGVRCRLSAGRGRR
jgi:hypothetical protein